VTYRPREFWEERLREQFDLRGTGETGLSLAYNRACYRLRERVLERALREARLDPAGRDVLDVGCGTGFFTELYLRWGARVTGIDITAVAVERLSVRFPQARFLHGDVGETPLAERFDVVNVFDVLYHITDDGRWEQAVRNLAGAVAPGGLLLITDVFAAGGPAGQGDLADHNRMRSLDRYRGLLDAGGIAVERLHGTHVLLNRELGPARFLNRLPSLLYAADRALLASGLGEGWALNRLLVGRRAP
jgi:SAM-dependent methyltransferase